MKDSLKKLGKKFGKLDFLFTVMSLVITFLADILQPILPFVFYLFIFSAIVLIGLVALRFLRPNFKYNTKGTLAFSSSLFLLTGLLSFFNQTEASQEKGVLASNGFEVAEILQSSLGIIQKDLASIKETIEKLEENTEKNIQETKKVVEAIQESTKSVVSSINKIQKNFSELNQSGGIINNPSTPEQFYHNARIYELNGDYGNARRSYNKYLSFKLDFLDPHLRYQTFLKIQEGKAGAREIYNAIYENDPRPIVEFSRILLYESPRRTEMLKAFVKKNPEFGPAFFELSNEFSKVRIGEQLQKDKGNEKKYLKKFNELNEEGKFVKYFIDKNMASKLLNNAKERMTALENFDEKILENPVLFRPMPSNSGWTFEVTVIDIATELFYRFEDEKTFTSMGFMPYLDSRTGKKMPGNFVNAPLNQGKTKIYFKYTGIKGKEHGPFEIVFDPKKARYDFCKLLKKQIGDGAKRYPGCETF